jgi:hypothetical protein
MPSIGEWYSAPDVPQKPWHTSRIHKGFKPKRQR